MVFKPRLAADLDYITSQRYLARDRKNAFNRALTKICRKYGFLEKDEDFNSETILSKVVFVVAQFSYTIVTILHPPLLFQSYYFSCFYLVIVFTVAVWNGASYYIEIFSTRYNLKFVVRSDEKMDRKQSLGSVNGGQTEDLEILDDEEFAEALEDIGFNELLANHFIINDDDATSTTSSKGNSLINL